MCVCNFVPIITLCGVSRFLRWFSPWCSAVQFAMLLHIEWRDDGHPYFCQWRAGHHLTSGLSRFSCPNTWPSLCFVVNFLIDGMRRFWCLITTWLIFRGRYAVLLYCYLIAFIRFRLSKQSIPFCAYGPMCLVADVTLNT